MTKASHHRSRLPTIRLGFSFVMVLAACSDRQVEPDISEKVELACTGDCNTAHACGSDPFHTSADECIAECVDADRWKILNQCTSASLVWQTCLGTLSCEQIDTYQTWVVEGGKLSEDFPCYDEAHDWFNCSVDEPFEGGA